MPTSRRAEESIASRRKIMDQRGDKLSESQNGRANYLQDFGPLRKPQFQNNFISASSISPRLHSTFRPACKSKTSPAGTRARRQNRNSNPERMRLQFL